MFRQSLKFFLAVFSCILLHLPNASAVVEYFNGTVLKGISTQPISAGGFKNFTKVSDEKYYNPSLDPKLNFNQDLIKQGQLANNTIKLSVLDHLAPSADFTAKVELTVKYYDYDNYETTPKVEQKVLELTYSKAAAAVNKLYALYAFTGGFYVEVSIDKITINNEEKTEVSYLQLENDIAVTREYNFNGGFPVKLNGTASFEAAKSHLAIHWPSVGIAREYDLEWAVFEEGTQAFTTSLSLLNSNSLSHYSLEPYFRNNASRITTEVNSYDISLIYSGAYNIAVRIRYVLYDEEGVRQESNWSYLKYPDPDQDATGLMIWNAVDKDFEKNLNWQYSVNYAEEGKKKEVISFADGSLRARQSVTVNSSDRVAVVQENIYDEFGRQVASILPAPYKEGGAESDEYLHYVPGFNKNVAGKAYSSADLGSDPCTSVPAKLGDLKGAAQYYSANNQFLQSPFNSEPSRYNKLYNAYIPHADGYPLSVTQYTPDNTGRIKQQGGVGEKFQPKEGSGTDPVRTTRYYYGKPEQWELDRLFGNDVGNASHYLKNMVIDPNGQVSVSYLNASGKTIATALTGNKPGTADGIEAINSPGITNTEKQILINNNQFQFDASELRLSATTTYLASVPGDAEITYDIQKIVHTYEGAAFHPCSNCFYELTIQVKDDCGNSIVTAGKTKFIEIGKKLSDCNPAQESYEPITVKFNKIGAYTVSFDFALKKSVIDHFTDEYITGAIQNRKINNSFYYVFQELKKIDYKTLLGNCQTAGQLLGSREDFDAMHIARLKAFNTKFEGTINYLDIPEAETHPDYADWKAWLKKAYDDAKVHVIALENACKIAPKSPCDLKKEKMLADLMPGTGQYALLTPSGEPLEPSINVLYLHYKEFFPDLSFSDLITQWDPTWAEKFLTYHPEKCKLDVCSNLAADYIADAVKKQEPVSSYTRGSTTWLSNYLANDKFFRAGGLGATYSAAMSGDLTNYSKNYLKIDKPELTAKNILSYIDYSLYTSTTAEGSSNAADHTAAWNATASFPTSECQPKLEREWELFKSLYYELKEKYYSKFYEANADPQKCTGCKIGAQPVIPTGDVKYSTANFSVETYIPQDGQLPPIGNCGGTILKIQSLTGAVNSNLVISLTDLTSEGMPSPQVYFYSMDKVKYLCIPANISPSSVKIVSVSDIGYCGQVLESKTIVGATHIQGDDYTFYDEQTQSYKTLFLRTGSCQKIQRSIYYEGTEVRGFYKEYVVNGKIYKDVWESVGYFDALHYNYSDFECYLEMVGNYGLVNIYAKPYVVRGFPLNNYSFEVFYKQGYTWNSIYVTVDQGAYQGTREFSYYEVGNQMIDDVRMGEQSIIHYANFPIEVDPCKGYAAKTSHFSFRDYDQVIPTGLNQKTTTENQIASQAGNSCLTKATFWVRKLRPGLEALYSNETNKETLITTAENALELALATVCQNGSDNNHPGGASTVKPGKSGDQSFGAAIKRVLGLTNYTAGLNPWLLDGTYPHGIIAQTTNKTISSTTQKIKDKIAALKAEKIDKGVAGSFYNYLKTTYGKHMKLTEAEWNDLENASACYNLLPKDITLPVFLDESGNSKGCISNSEYQQTLSDMQSAFSSAGITSADPNYEPMYSTYINFKYGLTLAYFQYKLFEKEVAVAAATGKPEPALCNIPVAQMLDSDPMLSTYKAVDNALAAGMSEFDKAIAVERLNFQADYVKTCAGAKAFADIEATTENFHYTLYYYDQAGNLVQTVPPEGVMPLKKAEIVRVESARKGTIEPSAFQRDALSALSDVLSTTGTGQTIEFWLNTAATGQQILATTPDKKYMLQVCINGNKLNADIYSLGKNPAKAKEIAILRSNHISVMLNNALPLPAWNHVVIRGLDLTKDKMEVLVNNLASTEITSQAYASCGWELKGTATAGLVMPLSLNTVKQLRVYTTKMSDQVITSNYQDPCRNPTTAYSGWLRTDGAPQTGCTQYAFQFDPLYPAHRMATTYAYTSFNQVYEQYTPDGKASRFWYDNKGRLAFSENAAQAARSSDPTHPDISSYTKYDNFGRITEVGELEWSDNPLLYGDPFTNDLDFNSSGTRSQITQTIYDDAFAGKHSSIGTQDNLRKRVAARIYRPHYNTLNADINATYYSYDIAGNVKTLWQQIKDLGDPKRIDYEYDLVSGKVNFVAYQHWKKDNLLQKDRFYYQYKYDAENRITEAWSGVEALKSSNGMGSYLHPALRRLNAHYEYYLHGPLARVELGDELYKVQGLDYAYTLQGWIKGVNGQQLGDSHDIGKDGSRVNTVKDAMAYALGYFENDYKPIVSAGNVFNLPWTAKNSNGTNLYNGNISNASYAIAKVNSGAPSLYTYRYDQLNRLIYMRQHDRDLSSTSGTWKRTTGSYAENFSYDANGNILSLGRFKGLSQMDTLTYTYETNTAGVRENNRLISVSDNAADDVDNNDIEGTTTYGYDAIGNLIKEKNGNPEKEISWTVYGKIDAIQKRANTGGALTNVVKYSYDAAGNRVSKDDDSKKTFYVRDAQGNSLAVYEKQGTALTWKEQQLYGSSRLGMWMPETNVGTTEGNTAWNTRGKVNYELSNHLGNVLAVVSDKRIPVTVGNVTTYESEILSAQDYYAFGMRMSGRNGSLVKNATTGEMEWKTDDEGDYRYGFNGKENDNDIGKGDGNQQDYGMRIYDPRLGRFLSVDPITKEYPELTPYQFASNNPIENIDLDGLEGVPARLQSNGTVSSAQSSTYQVQPKIKVPAAKLVWEETWAMADIHGNGQIGPKSVVRAKVAAVEQSYRNAVGDNIRNGIGGALGSLIGGDKGSFVGATFDGVAMSVGGLNVPGVFPKRSNSAEPPLASSSLKIEAEVDQFSNRSDRALVDAFFSANKIGTIPRSGNVGKIDFYRSDNINVPEGLRTTTLLMYRDLAAQKKTEYSPDKSAYKIQTNRIDLIDRVVPRLTLPKKQ